MRPPPQVTFDPDDSEQITDVFQRLATEINAATEWMAEALAELESKVED